MTVTANGNTVDSPDKSVTVSGTAAGGNGVANPPNATLALEDDDARPTALLVLTPSAITETGGVSTVTATLSGPSSGAVTVTVAAAAVSPAVSGDFALSTAKTLTIAAGAMASTGTVTVTANDVGWPDKSVTVSGTATGGNGVASPPNATLTLGYDDPPTIALVLTPTCDYGDGRGFDGDGEVVVGVERSGDADGGCGGGGVDGCGCGGLHPEHEEDADHRGGLDGEHRRGDGDRERQ